MIKEKESEMTMKCDRCHKFVDQVTEILWQYGPNGNRRYKLCDMCLLEVKRNIEKREETK